MKALCLIVIIVVVVVVVVVVDDVVVVIPFCVQWNLLVETAPIKGHKIWSRKNVHIICVFVTSVEGTPLFRGKRHFFWSGNPGLLLLLWWCCCCYSFLCTVEPLVWDSSNQGTQNLIPEKCSHNLCICYLCWRDTSIQGKETLFLVRKPGFKLHSGDTLALKTWLTTKSFINLQSVH